MKYSDSNPPLQCFMDQSNWMKGALTNGKPVGILWHDTAAGNPYIKRYVQPDDDAPNRQELLDIIGINQYGNDWNHSDRDAGVNAFVGRLADESISTVQVGPWDTHAWGCGGGDKGSCNGYVRVSGSTKWVPEFWIQFEMCDDGYTDQNYFLDMYREACELTAYLCQKFNIDPLGTTTFAGVKVPTILCHQDSYRLDLGSDHSDVLKWFKKFGYTMDNVRRDVNDILKAGPTDPIKVGDLVSIKKGATWWSGSEIPDWVMEQNWFVSKLSGDRAVIDENEDHTDSICSPINVNNLILVQPAEDFEPEPVPDTDTNTNIWTLYRVGRSVEEIKQQHISYIDFEQARRICDEKGYGYYVFTLSGIPMYAAPAPEVETPTESDPVTDPDPTDPNDGGAPSTDDPTSPSEKDVNWFVRMIKAFIEALRRIFTSESKEDK